MFEKEAERCAEEYRMSDDYSSAEQYDIGYANGLEIGFEKGAKFGYNKANEWNYPSKGEYPKDGSKVNAMFYNTIDHSTNEPCGRIDICMATYLHEEWFTDDNGFIEKDHWLNKKNIVYAWKEIVLPKESE